MILVAGIGNIFLGDDAFGSEAARAAQSRIASPKVRVVDFGIRGLDLAFALMDDYEAVILIDAAARGGEPGTLYVLEPDLNELDEAAPSIESHAMDPMRVLALAHSMGAELNQVTIVACEPETFGAAGEGQMGLSPRVAAAVEPAIGLVEELVRQLVCCRRGLLIEASR